MAEKNVPKLAKCGTLKNDLPTRDRCRVNGVANKHPKTKAQIRLVLNKLITGTSFTDELAPNSITLMK